eukprot:CAMPEP_0197536218 /NCGR_PEP_ID=MMETSP1318-20131121/53317_1 /TAXON_ID=552666 /ORGANISM="Partenskyella glossopodia, Strain RCC365" /LENGTH=79 /DNA_ID=CAMNT_0043094051 /DNA_START=251 /DNA_END=487 /DNA_ORIENTATION=+
MPAGPTTPLSGGLIEPEPEAPKPKTSPAAALDKNEDRPSLTLAVFISGEPLASDSGGCGRVSAKGVGGMNIICSSLRSL